MYIWYNHCNGLKRYDDGLKMRGVKIMEFKKTVKKILSALMAAAIVATTSVQVGEVSVSAASYSSTKLSAPANFKATATTSTSITLSWSKVSGADGYAIMYYNSSSKKYEDIFEDDYIITTNSIKITGLKSNTSYSLKVVALDKKGSKYYYQTYSKPLSVKTKSASSSATTTTSKLAAPTGLKCTAKSTNSVSIKWNAVKGAAGYRVYQYNEYTKSYFKRGDTSSNSVKITKLDSGKTYTFKIVTLKKSGNKYVEQNYIKGNFTTKLGSSKISLVGHELDDAVRLLESCGLKSKNIVYSDDIIVKNNWTVTAQQVKGDKIYLTCKRSGYLGILDAIEEFDAQTYQLADDINTIAGSVTEILEYFK